MIQARYFNDIIVRHNKLSRWKMEFHPLVSYFIQKFRVNFHSIFFEASPALQLETRPKQNFKDTKRKSVFNIHKSNRLRQSYRPKTRKKKHSRNSSESPKMRSREKRRSRPKRVVWLNPTYYEGSSGVTDDGSSSNEYLPVQPSSKQIVKKVEASAGKAPSKSTSLEQAKRTVNATPSSCERSEKEKKGIRVKVTHESRACEPHSSSEESNKENLRPSDDELSICKCLFTLYVGHFLNALSSAISKEFHLTSALFPNVISYTYEGQSKPTALEAVINSADAIAEPSEPLKSSVKSP